MQWVKEIVSWLTFLVFLHSAVKRSAASSSLNKPYPTSAEFYLFPHKSDTFHVISLDNSNLESELGFQRTNPTRLIMLQTPDQALDDSNKILREYYDNKGDYNKIVVNLKYPKKGSKSESQVSAEIGQLLQHLNRTYEVQLNETIVVASGIAAHVAGNAGKWLYQNHEYRLGLIIGLNPSMAKELPKEMILTKLDAEGVAVYHTNVNRTGIFRNVGTADIYANNQTHQPECVGDTLEQLDECSHQMALLYFMSAELTPLKRCRGIPDAHDSWCRHSDADVPIINEYTFKCGLRGIYWLDTTPDDEDRNFVAMASDW